MKVPHRSSKLVVLVIICFVLAWLGWFLAMAQVAGAAQKRPQRPPTQAVHKTLSKEALRRCHVYEPCSYKEYRAHYLALLRQWWVKEWERRDRGIHSALWPAAQRFGVSFSWLHSCNHTEGSHGMVWNAQGSDAFGPMQFMPGTFSSYSPEAFRRAKIPSKYRHRWSYVGQAYTAAYMFSIGESGHWTGRGC